MAAGVSDALHDMEWIVGLIGARGSEAEPARDLSQASDFKLRHYLGGGTLDGSFDGQ